MLFPKCVLASAALAAGTAAAAAVVDIRQAGGNFGATTQNDLTGMTSATCKSTIIVFARGTTEGGNVGSLVGPKAFQAVAAKMGAGASLAVQGVEYPANVQGFLAGGDATGSKTMAGLVTKAVQMCPNSSVVMSGYSQGGQLVHNAAKALPVDVTSKVSAVIFGDPDNGKPVAGVAAARTKVICHTDDNICQGGSQIKQAHLTYGTQNAGEAADFIVSMGSGMTAMVGGAVNASAPAAGASAAASIIPGGSKKGQ